MELIAISHPEFIPNEAERINALFRAGLMRLHIRKPHCNVADLSQLIGEIDPAFHANIALHSHHELAAEFGIKRLHFPEKLRQETPDFMLEKLSNAGFKLSTSIHDIAALTQLSKAFDYTLFGPVFDSISKEGYQRVINDDFYLKEEQKTIKVIAIGGIDHSNLNKIKQMNFDGAAMLGAIWHSDSFFKSFSKIAGGLSPRQNRSDSDSNIDLKSDQILISNSSSKIAGGLSPRQNGSDSDLNIDLNSDLNLISDSSSKIAGGLSPRQNRSDSDLNIDLKSDQNLKSNSFSKIAGGLSPRQNRLDSDLNIDLKSDQNFISKIAGGLSRRQNGLDSDLNIDLKSDLNLISDSFSKIAGGLSPRQNGLDLNIDLKSDQNLISDSFSKIAGGLSPRQNRSDSDLYLISDFKKITKLHFISNQTLEISHLDSINLALEAGCKWIQLRVKDQDESEVLQIAKSAKPLCENYGAKLIINDFPNIAKAVSAHGLHLGLNDMPIPEARNIVGDNMIIGGTANTFEDILLRIEEGADYIGLGPFRFTKTKQNLSPTLGLEGYRDLMKRLAKEKKEIPIIAIGGILPDDIPTLLSTGIHGVAMSSALIQSKVPRETVQKLEEILC
ncbi:thiamine phosphate synthase [Dyadobacter chenhuakuii]|uniref:Thiamine-phosphate synthase n=1 Tax=Dyadobacter chenhuakuii TaxID=2909339 RepID=A0A9X1U083_9BACT|nr:thiamine phosphate synthase [Dyadobacter chenhuakuii]MCF2498026.1 thiamine phosphate synthase [Dyadobacter chenhuakuii]